MGSSLRKQAENLNEPPAKKAKIEPKAKVKKKKKKVVVKPSQVKFRTLI